MGGPEGSSGRRGIVVVLGLVLFIFIFVFIEGSWRVDGVKGVLRGRLAAAAAEWKRLNRVKEALSGELQNSS